MSAAATREGASARGGGEKLASREGRRPSGAIWGGASARSGRELARGARGGRFCRAAE